MSEHLVNTRVGKLKVSVEGEGQQRPTALLWHSLFVDEHTWERVLPDLVQERQLVLVTGPGHGSSGDPGRRYTLDDCAEAALEVLDALGIVSPVDWVGNAWGGHVGILFAAHHPDRVRTLVTAGTPTHPYGPADRLSTSVLLAVYRVVGPIAYLTNAVADALLSERTRTSDPSAARLVRDCFVAADRARMANAVVSVSFNRLDLKPVLSGQYQVRHPCQCAHPSRARPSRQLSLRETPASARWSEHRDSQTTPGGGSTLVRASRPAASPSFIISESPASWSRGGWLTPRESAISR